MYLPLIALLNSGSVIRPVFAYDTSPLQVTYNSIPVGGSMELTGIWKSGTHDGIGPLYGIDAASPDDAWAVGKSSTNPSRALAVRWDGTDWRVAYSMGQGYGNNLFNNVKAISSDNVWAVGASDTNIGSTPTGLIAHWDGLTWSFVDTGLDLYDSQFTAVDASAPDDIWIIGAIRPLHWDGTRWEWINTRYPLGSISVLAADNAWGTSYASILHWDGKTWTETLDSESGPWYSSFHQITMLPDGTGWAAGYSFYMGGANNPPRLVLLHWDGKRWSESQAQDLPQDDLAYHQEILTGDYCCAYNSSPGIVMRLKNFAVLSGNDVYAVGQEVNAPLVAHWDGAKWTNDECPGGEPGVPIGISPYNERPSRLLGPLHDVAEVKEGVAWAVGETQDGKGYVLDLRPQPCQVVPPTATPLLPTRELGK